MSLIGALNVGRTALATHQAALQVTGNNIANAGNADYARQTSQMQPISGRQIKPGVFLGGGVDLTAVQRQVDEALAGRLRASVSDQSGAATAEQWLGRVEAVFNELGDQDLSTQMSAFFNAWSDLANRPQDASLRQVVMQSGSTLAKWFRDVRSDLGHLQIDADTQLQSLTANADRLAQRVADLNQQIVVAEGGTGGMANGLRDQRDTALKQLSELIDIKTVADGGLTNVYVGSEPLVIGVTSRGVALKQETVNGALTSTVVFKSNNGAIKLTGGSLGALNQVRSEDLGGVIDQVDSFAHSLIFELNKVHSSGQGAEGFTGATSTNALNDATAALTDPSAGMKFSPVNGSFVVHVKDKQTGLVSSTLVQVDLDGRNGNDTSLSDLATSMNSISGLSAQVSAGKLTISAAGNNVEFGFSQDSSGVLAGLGVNTYFSGADARDIDLNSALRDHPMLLAAAKNGQPADNQTALAIAAMQTTAMGSLQGRTLNESYQSVIDSLAGKTSAAKSDAEASRVVLETLQAQRESLSGVSLDEEAVNMIKQQRAFQGAARLVAAVDELMKQVLQLV